MRALTAVFVIALWSICASQAASEKKVVCYWGTWAVYRHGNAKFTVNDIDPTKCSHIIYTFFGANEDGTWKSLDPYLDLTDNYGKGYISKFIKLRAVNPSVKLLASIGGWNMGGHLFSKISSSSFLRQNFAKSVLGLLTKFGFDGFDLDWEYPKSGEKKNFVKLLQDLRKTLQPAGKLLTIAAGATEYRVHESYDIRSIVPEVDFVNLMTYDLHGQWDQRTGINAPLYSNNQLSVDSCVKFWLSEGCPKEKLVVGLATYGRSFTLQNPNNHNIGQPASAGRPGKFIPDQSTAGFLPYNEICTDVKRNGWTRVFDQNAKAPYAYKGDQWVGYDDIESMRMKVEYIKSNQLGGAMFWSIETDDFGNICGDGKNPLLSLAHQHLSGDSDEDYSESSEHSSSDDEESSEEFYSSEEESAEVPQEKVPLYIKLVLTFSRGKNAKQTIKFF